MGGQVDEAHFAEGETFNEDGIPTDIDEQGRCLIPELVPSKEVTEERVDTFDEYLANLPEWKQDLLGNAEEVNDGTKNTARTIE